MNMRCQRCQGFLVDCSYRYDSIKYNIKTTYNNKKHCINCGRNWEVVRGAIVEFPNNRGRNGDTKK